MLVSLPLPFNISLSRAYLSRGSWQVGFWKFLRYFLIRLSHLSSVILRSQSSREVIKAANTEVRGLAKVFVAILNDYPSREHSLGCRSGGRRCSLP